MTIVFDLFVAGQKIFPNYINIPIGKTRAVSNGVI